MEHTLKGLAPADLERQLKNARGAAKGIPVD